jgi:hypothetical protein
VNDPKNNKMLIDRGAQPVGSTLAEHTALIKSEIAKWKKVAQAAGAQARRRVAGERPPVMRGAGIAAERRVGAASRKSYTDPIYAIYAAPARFFFIVYSPIG